MHLYIMYIIFEPCECITHKTLNYQKINKKGLKKREMLNLQTWLLAGGICEGVAFCGGHITWASAYQALAPPILLIDWRQELAPRVEGLLFTLFLPQISLPMAEIPVSLSPDNWSRTLAIGAPWRRMIKCKSLLSDSWTFSQTSFGRRKADHQHFRCLDHFRQGTWNTEQRKDTD